LKAAIITAANEVLSSENEINEIVHKLKEKHISRLHADLKESIETSGLHMDVLDQYTRINDILSDIASAIVKKKIIKNYCTNFQQII
jgi:Na+/phosphate symporter